MFLITKDNITEKLLAELANTPVLLDSKFGIKQVVVESINVRLSLDRSTGRGEKGYLFRRVQGPCLLRSDDCTFILHGIAEDMVRFIKTGDYDLGGER